MSIKAGRILVVAVAVEALAIIGLVIVVALLGPLDPDAARAYAQETGYWFGPSAGFVLCIAGGWFVARRLTEGQILNGLVLGAAVAAIDVALIIASGAPFQFIFVVSNVGRIVAGTIGGWIASRGNAGAA